jgi:hypothetical protein
LPQSSMSRIQTASIFRSVCSSRRVTTSGRVFHILLAFTERGVPSVNVGTAELTTAICFLKHLQCFYSTFLDFMQDLITVLFSSVIIVATHQKLIYKTCHNSRMAYHRLVKLDHVLLKGW